MSNTKNIVILLAFIITVIVPVQAIWKGQSVKNHPSLKKNGFIQTVENNIDLKLDALTSFPSNKFIHLDHPYFHKPLNITINLRMEVGKIKRAPLMVVLVGVFGNAHKDDFDIVISNLLSKMGYHILIIPSSFSMSSTLSEPLNYPSSTLKEVEGVYKTIHMVQEKNIIPSKYISKTNIFGVSYGGFMAAILASESKRFDQEAQRRQTIDGNITIVGAPLNLRRSQDRLDELITFYESNSARPDSTFLILELLLKNTKESTAKKLIGKTFRHNLSMTVININNAKKAPMDLLKRGEFLKNNYKFVPKKASGNEFNNFLKGLRYRDAMNNYVVGDPFWGHPIYGWLKYWINKNVKVKGPEINLLGAGDDFINFGVKDPYSEFKLSKKNILLIKYGGHIGFISTPWFKSLIQSSLKI